MWWISHRFVDARTHRQSKASTIRDIIQVDKYDVFLSAILIVKSECYYQYIHFMGHPDAVRISSLYAEAGFCHLELGLVLPSSFGAPIIDESLICRIDGISQGAHSTRTYTPLYRHIKIQQK